MISGHVGRQIMHGAGQAQQPFAQRRRSSGGILNRNRHASAFGQRLTRIKHDYSVLNNAFELYDWLLELGNTEPATATRRNLNA